jgi:hypothetical protein
MLQKLASDSVSAICHPPAGPPNYGTVAATIVAELPDVIRAVIAGTALGRIDEMVLRGAIEGLMKSLWPASFIVSESYVQFEGQRLRPDIVLEWKSEKLVIELKSTRDVDRTIAGLGLREQLSQYAQAISATGAIGIVIPKTFPLNRTPVFATTPVRNMSVPMIIIHPSRD